MVHAKLHKVEPDTVLILEALRWFGPFNLSPTFCVTIDFCGYLQLWFFFFFPEEIVSGNYFWTFWHLSFLQENLFSIRRCHFILLQLYICFRERIIDTRFNYYMSKSSITSPFMLYLTVGSCETVTSYNWKTNWNCKIKMSLLLKWVTF